MDIKESNAYDYALWCKVLKKVKYGYKYNEVLAVYRKSDNSISSGSKFKLLKYHYELHRKCNNFNPFFAFFFTVTNIINYFINKLIREKAI